MKLALTKHAADIQFYQIIQFFFGKDHFYYLQFHKL